MLTRRSFLLGGAGAVVAAGVGVEVLGRERVLHRLGVVGSPDHHVPASGWKITESTLASGTRWALAEPPGGPHGGIVLCLHGRGNDHRYCFDTIRLHDVVADEGYRFAVAALDGGSDGYWHDRADGTHAGADVDELARRLVGTYFQPIAGLGWSMGGYGALLAAERQPGYGAVVASSPALYAGFDDAAPHAFDSAEDYARHDVFARVEKLDPTRVRIDCGDHDPFEPAARRLVEQLGPGVTSSFTRGYHDAAYWRSVAPAQVRFVAKAFSLPRE